MKQEYFNMIGQKAPDGKMILVAVVPDDIFGEVPSIFQVQAVRTVPTIYTGTYPTIRIISDTMEDKSEDLKGQGIEGILTSANWFNESKEDKNEYGINIKPRK